MMLLLSQISPGDPATKAELCERERVACRAYVGTLETEKQGLRDSLDLVIRQRDEALRLREDPTPSLGVKILKTAMCGGIGAGLGVLADQLMLGLVSGATACGFVLSF